MDAVDIKLNDEAAFDEAVCGKDSLPSGSDLQIITKDVATTGGNPGLVFTFTVRLPDGSLARAQATMTYGNFQTLAAALRGRYGPGGFLDLQRQGGAH